MKILLTASYVKKGIDLPKSQRYRQGIALALEQLAACTPEEHQIEIVDENCYDTINFENSYDLVGISTITPHAPRAYKIADEFRKKGVPVVLGGFHPSALPDEAKLHADGVVIGEADFTWPQLIEDLENDNLKPFYKQNQPIPADNNHILMKIDLLLQSLHKKRLKVQFYHSSLQYLTDHKVPKLLPKAQNILIPQFVSIQLLYQHYFVQQDSKMDRVPVLQQDFPAFPPLLCHPRNFHQ